MLRILVMESMQNDYVNNHDDAKNIYEKLMEWLDAPLINDDDWGINCYVYSLEANDSGICVCTNDNISEGFRIPIDLATVSTNVRLYALHKANEPFPEKLIKGINQLTNGNDYMIYYVGLGKSAESSLEILNNLFKEHVVNIPNNINQSIETYLKDK